MVRGEIGKKIWQKQLSVCVKISEQQIMIIKLRKNKFISRVQLWGYPQIFYATPPSYIAERNVPIIGGVLVAYGFAEIAPPWILAFCMNNYFSLKECCILEWYIFSASIHALTYVTSCNYDVRKSHTVSSDCHFLTGIKDVDGELLDL